MGKYKAHVLKSVRSILPSVQTAAQHDCTATSNKVTVLYS